MTIDTGARTIRIQAQKQLFAILLLIFIIGSAFARYYRIAPFFVDLNLWKFSMVLVAIYLLYYLYFPFRAVSYIYVSDNEFPGILTVRHFRIQPMDTNKMAYSIPLGEFHSYREEKSQWGTRHFLHLTQARGQQTYTYPPVSLTLLRKDELQRLRQLLDQHVKSQITQNAQ